MMVSLHFSMPRALMTTDDLSIFYSHIRMHGSLYKQRAGSHL